MADINVAEQADKKAEAKVEADHKVATEPHTIHGVRRMLGAPGMIPSIAAGAGLAGSSGWAFIDVDNGGAGVRAWQDSKSAAPQRPSGRDA